MRTFLTTAVLASFATMAHAQQASLPIGGFADDNTSAISSLAQAINHPVGLIDTYVDLRQPWSGFINSAQYAANLATKAPNATPVVGIPMATQGQDPDTAFRAIANGSYDSIITGMFQAFINVGFDAFEIRPGWEMNGTWMPWSVTPATAPDFVAAFQRIASLAHSMNKLIAVVWNPGVGGNLTPEQIYPGDAYVDLIGADSYGAPLGGPTPMASGNMTIQHLMSFAAAHKKQFTLPETGAANTDFVVELGNALSQSPVLISSVNIWNTNAACGGCAFAPGSAMAQAWQAAIAQITTSGKVGNGVAVSTGSGILPMPPVAPAAPIKPTIDPVFAAQIQSIEAEANQIQQQIDALPSQADLDATLAQLTKELGQISK